MLAMLETPVMEDMDNDGGETPPLLGIQKDVGDSPPLDGIGGMPPGNIEL